MTKLELGGSRKLVELDKRIYEYTHILSRTFDFIYDDLPMFGFIYEQLGSTFPDISAH